MTSGVVLDGVGALLDDGADGALLVVDDTLDDDTLDDDGASESVSSEPQAASPTASGTSSAMVRVRAVRRGVLTKVPSGAAGCAGQACAGRPPHRLTVW